MSLVAVNYEVTRCACDGAGLSRVVSDIAAGGACAPRRVYITMYKVLKEFQKTEIFQTNISNYQSYSDYKSTRF